MQLMMLDETMNGPQAVRYDEVYYPRTDKRSISKLVTLTSFVILQTGLDSASNNSILV